MESTPQQPHDPIPNAPEAPPVPPPDGKPHRKYYQRKNTFQPGNKAYRGGNGKRAKKTPLYRDLGYVWTHQNGPFKTDGHRKLKQQLDDDPKGFLQLYARQEQLHAAKTEKVPDPLSAGGKDAPSFDEGTQRCLELIMRLLKTRGWETKHTGTTSEVVPESKPSGAG